MLVKEMNGRAKKYTEDQKNRWVQLVDKERASGATISVAVKKVAQELKEPVSVSMYVWWKNVMEGKEPKKPQQRSNLKGPFTLEQGPSISHVAPTPAKIRVYVFEGDPNAISEALANLKKDS